MHKIKSHLFKTYKDLPYHTPYFKTDLNVTWPCCGSQIFYHGILQRNYRKGSYNGHFPIISL